MTSSKSRPMTPPGMSPNTGSATGIDFANAEVRVHDVHAERRLVQERLDTARCDSGAPAPSRAAHAPAASCEATHASNSRALNGLTRYSSAPACSPSMRASSPARAESRITGSERRPFVGANRGEQAEPVERRHHHVGQHEIRRAASRMRSSAARPSPTTSTR